MDRELQSAHSRQAAIEIEQQLGTRATASVGYQYLRGLDLIASVNQNVPGLRRHRYQQRLPSESGLCEQQPVFVGGTFELSRSARVVHAAPGPVGSLIGFGPRCRNR